MEELAEQLPDPVYKSRLLLGEGDFSYTFALVRKHLEDRSNLGWAITATAYEEEDDLRKKYSDTFDTHVNFLRTNGVTLLFGIDATKIHLHPGLKNRQFECIHFNCPHDGKPYNGGTLKRMLGEFYKSARELQPDGGKIYMALPKPPEDGLNRWYKVNNYDIYTNTRNAGYRIVGKHEFNAQRYPGYTHVKTKNDTSASIAQYSKEYVFEKTTLTAEQILEQDHRTDKRVIPELKTDGNSTDYYFLQEVVGRITLISTLSQAKAWINELNLKKSKFQESSQLEPRKTVPFVNKMHSIQIFLLGDSTQHFYNHSIEFSSRQGNQGNMQFDAKFPPDSASDYSDPTHKIWKSHVTLWYYRAQNIVTREFDKQAPNIDLLYQFSNLLYYIVEKTASAHESVIMCALEGLFYFYDLKKELAVKAALHVLKRNDAGWHSKAISLGILLRYFKASDISFEKIVPIIVQQLGYDPRLDWMLCMSLGKIDLDRSLCDKSLEGYFDSIVDFRLIYLILKNTHSNQMPNRHYRWISDYIMTERNGLELTEAQRRIKSAVHVDHTASIDNNTDLFTGRSEIVCTSLINNVFMPAQSITIAPNGQEKMQGFLQPQHEVPSLKKLGEFYSKGIHGCPLDACEALIYLRKPASSGDLDPLFHIVRLAGQGLIDLGGEHLPEYLDHCIKLLRQSKFTPSEQADIYNCRAIVNLMLGNNNDAQISLNLVIQLNPDNQTAPLHLAFIACMKGQFDQALNLLRKVRNANMLYRNTLIYLSQHIKGALDDKRKLARILENASRGQKQLLLCLCGMIYFTQNIEDRGLAFFQKVIDEYPTHPLAISYYKKLDPQGVIQVSAKPRSYELIFRHYLDRESYARDKNHLQNRANSVTGFIVCIGDSPETIELEFLDVNRSVTLSEPQVLEDAVNILNAMETENNVAMHAALSNIHRHITENYAENIPLDPMAVTQQLATMQLAVDEAPPLLTLEPAEERETPLDPEEESEVIFSRINK